MSQEQILKDFGEFGKYIYYIALCILLALIPYVGIVMIFVELYYIIKALGVIKRINLTLQNPNLEEFRRRIILGFIIAIVGTIISVIVMISFFVMLVGFSRGITPYAMYGVIFAFVGILFLVMIIAGYFQLKAWENLNIFFTENQQMFPPHLARDAIDGTKNLKTAATCMMLFFLIITGIIGFIFQILGYFNLGRLRELELGQYQASGAPSYSPTPAYGSPSPPPVSQSGTPSNFCHVCGEKLRQGVKFCPKCGSEI